MKIEFPVRLLSNFDEKFNNDFVFQILSVVSISNLCDHALFFVKKLEAHQIKKISKLDCCVMIIANQNIEKYLDVLSSVSKNNVVVFVDNPRLYFAKVLNYILRYENQEDKEYCYASSIGNNFILGKNSKIGHNVVIGNNVCIGDHCKIKAGVIINDDVMIKNHTIIRENTVIGGWGFGFERDEKAIPVRIPHIGGVCIGNNVEIGALTTVCSGTMEPTVIKDDTKIDDRVTIAHNCSIGERCLIAGGANVAGSVKTGNNCWIGAGATLRDGIEIGGDCFIGMGAVVKKSIGDNVMVSDNPAKFIERLAEERQMNNFLLKNYKKGKLDYLKD